MINLVTFPALGLEFLLNRVAFEVLGRPIYWYGVIIACGFFLGSLLAAKLTPQYGLTEETVYDFLLFAVPAAFVGLRVYYVLFYLDLYKNPDGSLNWGAMFRISDGGMAIYGGIIAGVLTLFFFTKARKISFWALADVMTVGLILGQCIGRWGNFMNVEAYGGLTTGPWRMCSQSIATEMVAKGYATNLQYEEILAGTLGVHPTFFYESMWNLIGVGLLLWVGQKWKKFYGQGFLVYFLWYGLGRFVIEGMRTDSLYFFGFTIFGEPVRTSQLLSLGLALSSGVVLWLGLAGKISCFPPLKPVSETVDIFKEDSV